jgi:imidazolonepropionase-like amidohydrolase
MKLSNALPKAAILFAAVLFATGAGAETIAVTHGQIVSFGAAGTIKDGTVIIKDGRIAAVGANLAIPAGARVIDAGGHVVTPGLVASDTNLGAREVSEGEASTNDDAGATDSISAAFDVALGLNPASMVIPVARMGGVTRAVVTPELPGRGDKKGEKLFAGQAAVIDLSGNANSITRAHVAIAAELGVGATSHLGGSHASVLQRLEADLDEAASYAANKAGYEKGAHRPYHQSKEDLEALQPVIAGKEPLLLGVHRVADIRRVIALGQRLKLKLILAGVEEGWMMASEIAAAGTPVLVDPQTNLPEQFEELNSRLENAGLLQAAGVTVVIVPPHNADYARQVRYNAGYAAAHGMSWEAAVAAITRNPAQVFGFAASEGTLEPGAEADLVVWSGDPLEMLTLPEHVLIKGVEMQLTSRAQELARRYATPDSPIPPTYRHN